jgi:DNA-binding XRE family transcriptional regulator
MQTRAHLTVGRTSTSGRGRWPPICVRRTSRLGLGHRVTPEEINLAIGKRLSARRKALGLSLAQVAERCDVSLQQIHRYEIGQSSLSVAMLVKLARCLDAPLSYFFETLEERPTGLAGVDCGAADDRR